MATIHNITAVKSFPLVNLFTTNGMIFGPSAIRASNSGPVVRVSEFGESFLLTHVFCQASYFLSKSAARSGDLALSLSHKSLADSTAAMLGGRAGAKGSM